MTGNPHRPSQFLWGMVIGTLGGFAGCIPWRAAFFWHVVVAVLSGILFGLFAREFGDRFWHRVLKVLRFLWHW